MRRQRPSALRTEAGGSAVKTGGSMTDEARETTDKGGSAGHGGDDPTTVSDDASSASDTENDDRNILDAAGAAMRATTGGIKTAAGAVADGMEAATGGIKTAAGAVADGMEAATGGIKTAAGAVADGMEAATGGIKTAAGAVADGMEAATGGIKTAAGAVADGVGAASRATKSSSIAAASIAQGVIVGTGSQINQLVQSMVSGPTSLYDKALDANYLDPLLRSDMGGSYHRLFDGGHTIAGAVRAVNEAGIDDPFARQTFGTVEALLRDVSTERGLPLATWDKATFDSVAQSLDSSLGIPKRWLYEINTFDASDVLGATIGVVAVALNWNKADTEKFAQLTAGMGISAVVSLNPLLLLVTISAAAQSFNKARISADYSALADGAVKGAAVSAASMGAVAAVTAAGGPAGVGLLAGLAAGMLVHQTVKNVSVSEITDFVNTRVKTLAPTVAAWAVDLLRRDDADSAERAIATEILALPSVTAAAEVAAPVVDELNATLANPAVA
ncbi:MAG: hypothetical protein OXC59_01660 [Acidimicrobiaceae bacterium]|nr:hypothetical protein [Acidimicrobiaceae bacterium]